MASFRFVVSILLVAGLMLAAGSPYNEALSRYNHTDFQSSLDLLLPLENKNAATLALIGQNYFMLGDARRATDFFAKAVAQDSANSVYYHWLGRAYGRRAETSNPFSALGHASKARQNFEKAVELDPQNSEAVNDLFEFYLEAPGFMGGGLDKATRIADKIAARDPAEGNYAHARIDEKRKEYSSAELHLRRAMELAPHQVGRVLDLAKFLAKQGRYQESDEAFQAAVRLAPDAPKVFYARAATYIQSGRNIETARALLEKYLASSVTPEDPPKSEARKLLRQASGS